MNYIAYNDTLPKGILMFGLIAGFVLNSLIDSALIRILSKKEKKR